MKISGTTARDHLNQQITGWVENALKGDLAPLDPIHTFNKIHELIRSIEEFINISTLEVDLDEFKTLSLIPLANWNPYYNNLLDSIIAPKFGKDVADRYKRIVLESHQMLIEFLLTGDNLGYSTVMEAVAFYQSRRRHILNIFYVVPTYCSGNLKLSTSELLRYVVNISNFCLINVTALYRQVILSHIYKDYEATIHPDQSITSNYQFDFLDKSFTEPERISINDPVMRNAFNLVSDKFAPMPGNKVFSLSELRNECTLIKTYFEFFNHNDPLFSLLIQVAEELIKFNRDDYFISVPQRDFDAILHSLDLKYIDKIKEVLLCDADDFVEISNSHHPFIKVGGYYKSNVNLILRFFYNWKNVSLNRCKQFQIRSGFIFEDNVKTELSAIGFQVMDVKRIKRKEFDVVTIRDGILFNFQCKNNFVDISLMEKNPAKFSKKNSLIVRYYLNALKKEVDREYLLTEKYGIADIRHFVISRFPVLTKEPSIVLFKDLDRFRPI